MVDQLAMLCADDAALARIQRYNAANRPAYDWSDVLWRTAYAYEAAAELVTGTGIPAPQVLLGPDRPRSSGLTGSTGA